MCLFILMLAGTSLAAPSELTEEDIPPPAAAAAPKPQPKPRKEKVTAPSQELLTTIKPAADSAPKPEAPRGLLLDKTDRTEKRDLTPVTATADSGDLSYAVRPGDTPSSIAELFHIDTNELQRANHLGTDTMLHVGGTLHIPNPYAAQVRALKSEVQKLSDDLDSARNRSSSVETDVKSLRGQIDELSNANQSLKHDVRVLPWWRAAATTAAVAGAFVLVIAGLALVDWFVLRRRFRTLAEMNESLRRLDNKYKAVMGKAELRFQQLYGRRRQGLLDGQELARIPEEFELERLNQELREILERHLDRLGAGRQNGNRRSWLRELFGSVEAPVPARTDRR